MKKAGATPIFLMYDEISFTSLSFDYLHFSRHVRRSHITIAHLMT